MMMAEVAGHNKTRRSDQNHFNSSSMQMTTSTSQEFDSIMTTSKKLKTSPTSSSIISQREKKDKVGERVAALQQLVSPFGKTDTASVLQEASAYIQFLHQQLQTLSQPYLRPVVAGKVLEDDEYYSLRNRGLCLMPITKTIHIAQSNGADLWAQTNSGKHRS